MPFLYEKKHYPSGQTHRLGQTFVVRLVCASRRAQDASFMHLDELSCVVRRERRPTRRIGELLRIFLLSHFKYVNYDHPGECSPAEKDCLRWPSP